MKITELYEGAEPRLPGAVSGIKIMTPQQFAGVEDSEQEVDEATALPAQQPTPSAAPPARAWNRR